MLVWKKCGTLHPILGASEEVQCIRHRWLLGSLLVNAWQGEGLRVAALTCGLAFSRLSPSVGPSHQNNWDGVDGPSMSDPDWNTSHLQTKMFYSSMEMPTSLVGCSSFGPCDAWAWGGAGGVGDVRILWAGSWLLSRAMASTSETPLLQTCSRIRCIEQWPWLLHEEIHSSLLDMVLIKQRWRSPTI